MEEVILTKLLDSVKTPSQNLLNNLDFSQFFIDKFILKIQSTPYNKIKELYQSNTNRTKFFLILTTQILKSTGQYSFKSKQHHGEFLTLDLTAFKHKHDIPFLIFEHDNGQFTDVYNDEFNKLLSVQSNYKILIYNFPVLSNFNDKIDSDYMFKNHIKKFSQKLMNNSKSLQINAKRNAFQINTYIIISYQFYTENVIILRYCILDHTSNTLKIHSLIIP